MKKITFLLSFLLIGLMSFGQALNEGFEGANFPPNRWSTIDADGDGYNWEAVMAPIFAHSGNGLAISLSWNDEALTPDNWLITPALIVASATDSIVYHVEIIDADYPAEHYAVKVSSTGTDTADFTTTLYEYTFTTQDTNVWKRKAHSLSQFLNDTIYVAFVHNECTNQDILLMDDITGPNEVSFPDVSVLDYTSPGDACGLADETVTVTVSNAGTTDVADLPIHYILDGGTPVDSIIPYTISSDSTVTFTFATLVNLSAPGAHTIKVYTTLNGDMDSSNDTLTITVTNVISSTAPYTMGFEPTENFLGWTIEDANNDGTTWSVVSIGGHNNPYVAEYNYNSNSSANDWLISKCIHLDASKTYKLSFWYKAHSSSYTEKLMVYIGDAPVSTSMTTMLTDIPSITNTTYTEKDVNFTVPVSGVYYIGWKCYSNADMWNLYVDDINITDATGITENTVNTIINVYPNPAKNTLNVYSSAKIDRIKLLNVYGQLVLNNEVNSANFTVNTSDLANGIYYLQIETKDGLTTKNITICK